MELLSVLVWSCVVVLQMILSVSSYNVNNIDVGEPIVRYSPATGTDLFGYAVTLHQVQTLEDGDSVETALEKSRVIIGAPRGTFPGGLDYPDLGDNADDQTGLVYVCPLLPGSCEGLRGNINLYSGNVDNDFDIAEGRMFDHYPTAQVRLTPGLGVAAKIERKSGQLMGATLHSNGDHFIACAPRWSYGFSNPQPRGRCYISDRSLTGFRKLWPCNNLAGDNSVTTGQSYCLAGTGVTIVENANSEDVIVMGAPGFDVLKGNLFYTTPSAYSPPDSLDAVSKGFTFTAGQSQAVATDGSLAVITSIYQGMQVVSGFITQAKGPDAIPDVITSVPRYNGTSYRGRVNIFSVSNPTAILNVTATGQQMAEFFGYSMMAADLTGDGYDELIVGAPMYSDVGEQLVELGRVYLFENLGGYLGDTPVILVGMVERGRFGNSLVNLGDLDDDGYEDIAVGAPYACKSPSRSHPVGPCVGQNTGAVYTYYGNPNLTEFSKQTAFEIHSDMIVQTVDGLEALNSFGFSIASGVDIDGNQYNDLVVGAYQSNLAVILRSFPVATVNFTLPEVDPIDFADPASKCSLDSQQHICFDIVVSAVYDGRGLSGNLSVNYTLSEVLVSGERRVFFEDMATMLTRTLVFNVTNEGATHTVRVYLEKTLVNVVSPLELRVEIPSEIPKPPVTTDGNQTAMDLTPYPRLRQTGMGSQTVGLCGVDMVCQYDLELSISSVQYISRTGEDEHAVDGIIAGLTEEIRIQFLYSNRGPEGASEPILSFNLTGVASDVILTSKPVAQECTVSATVFECSLESVTNYFSNETKLFTINLTLNVDQLLQTLQMGNTSFSITFGVIVPETPHSTDINTLNNFQTLNFTNEGEGDIEVTVEFNPEDSIRYAGTGTFTDVVSSLSDLGGATATLTVTIGNRGPTIIPNASLHIYFPGRPVGEDVSTYYLYPSALNIPASLQDHISCEDTAIDPDHLLAGKQQRRSVMHPYMREKRKLAIQSRKRRPRAVGDDIAVDCQVNPDACIVISCIIIDLDLNDDIEVRIDGVIDERFYKDKTSVFVLTAFATASITSGVLRDEAVTDNNNVTAQLTVSPVGVRSEDDDFDLLFHIIFWPIVAALLLLTVITFILYCCGWFRRKKKAKAGQREEDVEVSVTDSAEEDTKSDELRSDLLEADPEQPEREITDM